MTSQGGIIPSESKQKKTSVWNDPAQSPDRPGSPWRHSGVLLGENFDDLTVMDIGIVEPASWIHSNRRLFESTKRRAFKERET
jgi:hypothetical protein